MCLNITLVVHNFRVGTCCSGMRSHYFRKIGEKQITAKKNLIWLLGVSVTIMMLLCSWLYSKFTNITLQEVDRVGRQIV